MKTRALLGAVVLAVVASCSTADPPADDEVTPERQPFLDALTSIEPALTVDPGAALTRAKAVCADMETITREQAVGLVPARFDSLMQSQGDDIGERIMAAIESTDVCATFARPE